MQENQQTNLDAFQKVLASGDAVALAKFVLHNELFSKVLSKAPELKELAEGLSALKGQENKEFQDLYFVAKQKSKLLKTIKGIKNNFKLRSEQAKKAIEVYDEIVKTLGEELSHDLKIDVCDEVVESMHGVTEPQLKKLQDAIIKLEKTRQETTGKGTEFASKLEQFWQKILEMLQAHQNKLMREASKKSEEPNPESAVVPQVSDGTREEEGVRRSATKPIQAGDSFAEEPQVPETVTIPQERDGERSRAATEQSETGETKTEEPNTGPAVVQPGSDGTDGQAEGTRPRAVSFSVQRPTEFEEGTVVARPPVVISNWKVQISFQAIISTIDEAEALFSKNKAKYNELEADAPAALGNIYSLASLEVAIGELPANLFEGLSEEIPEQSPQPPEVAPGSYVQEPITASPSSREKGRLRTGSDALLESLRRVQEGAAIPLSRKPVSERPNMGQKSASARLQRGQGRNQG